MAVYDDDVVSRDVRRNDSNAFSWLVPLLLVVVAFFAGWWANAYTTNNNSRSGLQPGIGGGPGNVNNVAPTRGNTKLSPTVSPMVSLTPTPTTVQPTATPTVNY